MRPSFALRLRHDGIALLHRGPAAWRVVGDEVALDDPAMESRLADLRDAAQRMAPDGFTTKLILPNAEILYDTVAAPGPTEEERRAQIEAALEGRTPYALHELAYDYAVTSGVARIAVVAHETLAEAESFALGFGFNPVIFAAFPDPGQFLGEPLFGPTAAAADLLPPGEMLEREEDLLPVSGRIDPPAEIVAPEPDPEPVSDPEGAVEAAPEPTLSFGRAAAPAADPTPPPASDPAPKVTADPAPTAPDPAVPEPAPEPAAAEPAAPVALSVFQSRRAKDSDIPPEPAPSRLDHLKSRFALKPVGGAAPAVATAPRADLDRAPEPGLTPPPLAASAPPLTAPARGPAAEVTPLRAPAPEPVEATPVAQPKAKPAKAAKPAKDKTEGAGNRLALYMTIGLIVLLLGIAFVSSMFEGEPADTPSVNLAAPDDLDTALLEEFEPEQPTPVPTAPARSDLELSAEAHYAATGVWVLPPEAPARLQADDVDDLYATSLDPRVEVQDALALSRYAPGRDTRPAEGLPLPGPGLSFDLDPNGRVVATPDGALAPEGFTVTLGQPPLVPPARPETVPDTITPTPVDNPLARLRPPPRPDNAAELIERAALDGRSFAELAALRPRPRPESAQTETLAVDPDPDGTIILAASPAPPGRPAGFDKVVAAIREKQGPATDTVTPAAARAVTPAPPSIPTRASVAKTATSTNAIKLNDVNLIGVYGGTNDRRALVRLASGRYVKVEVGDRVDGGRVAAIGSNSLSYVKSGRNVTLTVPEG